MCTWPSRKATGSGASASAGRSRRLRAGGPLALPGTAVRRTSARLTYPFDVAVDSSGVVYVADTINHRIRRIGTDGINFETIAGTGHGRVQRGTAGEATRGATRQPVRHRAVNSAGYVFVADWGNHRIRRIAPDGTIETFAGNGGRGRRQRRRALPSQLNCSVPPA